MLRRLRFPPLRHHLRMCSADNSSHAELKSTSGFYFQFPISGYPNAATLSLSLPLGHSALFRNSPDWLCEGEFPKVVAPTMTIVPHWHDDSSVCRRWWLELWCSVPRKIELTFGKRCEMKFPIFCCPFPVQSSSALISGHLYLVSRVSICLVSVRDGMMGLDVTLSGGS